jgi:DNA helicase II / ATP-dependent DNA helicase PcrA
VKAKRASHRSVSVFTHSNASTSELSDAFTAAYVRHEQVGLRGVRRGDQRTESDVALRPQGACLDAALAVFVAANHRTNPPLVRQIMEASNPEFEGALDAVIRGFHAAAAPLDVERLADVIASAWARGWALTAGKDELSAVNALADARRWRDGARLKAGRDDSAGVDSAHV